MALALFPRGVPHVPLPCCISCFGMHSTTKCPILGSNSGQGHPYLAPTPRESPPPQRTEHREARRWPGVIEPGSFIYTVKVTSNFLRLSCSSAIKSWRGYKSAVFSPARGEGSLQRRGHLRQPLPGGAHSPLRLCK